MKRKKQIMALAICVVLLMVFSGVVSAISAQSSLDETINDNAKWSKAVRGVTPSYPPLPSNTIDIKYDDGTTSSLSCGLEKTDSWYNALRVRFTPPAEVEGHALQEVRVCFGGYYLIGNGVLSVEIVDEDTGDTVTKQFTLTDGDLGVPEDKWVVFDVTDLNFIVDGNFYVEMIPINCDFMVHIDDREPISGRSEYDYLHAGWSASHVDLLIRAIVLTVPSRPTISIYTDKTSYTAGDTMLIGLGVNNPGSARSVNLDIYLDMPTGGTFTLLDKTVTLPAGLDYSKSNFKVITLPSISAGTYTWHAQLSDPVTGALISEDTAEWEFGSRESSIGTEDIREVLEQTYRCY